MAGMTVPSRERVFPWDSNWAPSKDRWMGPELAPMKVSLTVAWKGSDLPKAERKVRSISRENRMVFLKVDWKERAIQMD